MSFWHADNRRNFEKVFEGHKHYYKEVMEIVDVVRPADAMKLIINNMIDGAPVHPAGKDS